MNYSLSITQDNLTDIKNADKMHFDVENVYSCAENILEDASLGFFSEKFIHATNYSIVERNSMFTKDVKITESKSTPCFALSFILEGTNGFKFSKHNNVISRPSTNNIWSFGAGQERSILSKKNVKSRVLSFVFHEHYIEELVHKYPQHLSSFYEKYKNGKSCRISDQCHLTTIAMQQVITQIKQADLIGLASDIYTESKILELLALQLNSRNEKQNTVLKNHCKTIDDIEKIKEAKRVLVTNLNQPPSIIELSKYVGVNENKLKYGFKEIYNQTVYGYLFEHKMSLAHKLLLNTDKAIADIAFECGYGDSSHFTKAFKRKFDVSPRQYRNQTI